MRYVPQRKHFNEHGEEPGREKAMKLFQETDIRQDENPGITIRKNRDSLITNAEKN